MLNAGNGTLVYGEWTSVRKVATAARPRISMETASLNCGCATGRHNVLLGLEIRGLYTAGTPIALSRWVALITADLNGDGIPDGW